MAATSHAELAKSRPAVTAASRRLAIALLAIVAGAAGVVTTASVLSFTDRPARVSAPGLAPSSRYDHFRDGRTTTVSGSVGERWYLEPAPGSSERIRDRWYRE